MPARKSMKRPTAIAMQRIAYDLRERERKIWELKTQRGLTHQAIADELKIDRTTVTKTLSRISKRIQSEIDDQAVHVKQEQVETLQYIVSEAMMAWERSKLPTRSVTSKKTAGRQPGSRSQGEETTLRVDEPVGDAKFLTTAMTAMGDIRKLFRLDEEEKKGDTGSDNPNDITESERMRRLAHMFAEAEQRKQAATGDPVKLEPQ